MNPTWFCYVNLTYLISSSLVKDKICAHLQVQDSLAVSEWGSPTQHMTCLKTMLQNYPGYIMCWAKIQVTFHFLSSYVTPSAISTFTLLQHEPTYLCIYMCIWISNHYLVLTHMYTLVFIESTWQLLDWHHGERIFTVHVLPKHLCNSIIRYIIDLYHKAGPAQVLDYLKQNCWKCSTCGQVSSKYVT